MLRRMTTTWYRKQTLNYLLAVTSTDPDDPEAAPAPLSLDNLTSLDLRVKLSSDDNDPPIVIVGLADGWVVRTQTGGDLGKADLTTAADWLDGVDAGVYHYDIKAVWNDGTAKFVFGPAKVKIKNAP
jgi:hypothetical protein